MVEVRFYIFKWLQLTNLPILYHKAVLEQLDQICQEAFPQKRYPN